MRRAFPVTLWLLSLASLVASDECEVGTHNCDANAFCLAKQGAFTCACKPGYAGIGTSCSDVDECALSKDNCGPSAVCSNTDGSYECICNEGFEASCVDTPGWRSSSNYACIYYELTRSSGRVQESIGCPIGSPLREGDFSEPVGSFGLTAGEACCYCGGGHKTCVDVDECLLSDHCHESASCTNTYGSFSCTCNDGYDGDGVDSCSDRDECTGDGSVLVVELTHDMQECEAGQDVNLGTGFVTPQECGEAAINNPSCRGTSIMWSDRYNQYWGCRCCSPIPANTPPHHHALWDKYRYRRSSSSCDIHALCTNTDGSFACDCMTGFASTDGGRTCPDVDECALRTHDCDANAHCINTDGSFDCACNAGWAGPAVSACVDAEDWRSGGGFACESYAQYNWCTADGGYGTGWNPGDGTFEEWTGTYGMDATAACCVCGGGLSGCDADECAVQADDCDPNAKCSNTRGSFVCACNDGYGGNGVACGDVDECSLSATRWRLTNLEDIGWRPGITDMMMFKDLAGTEPVPYSAVISSGDNGQPNGTPEGALDGSAATSWRPHIHAPRAEQIWIGFHTTSPVAVQSAYAIQLGVGHAAGEVWSGGVLLQYSNDYYSWHTAAWMADSNEVQVHDSLPLQPAARYWRLTNNGACGWRPGVTTLKMFADTAGEVEVEGSEAISSASYGDDGPHRATDGNPDTAWRPAVGTPRADEVWIGLHFASATVVRRALAVGLGKGSGGGVSWQGGVKLQYSHDGERWTTLASKWNSDEVSLPGPPSDTCGPATCSNTQGSYLCVCEEGFDYQSREKMCIARLETLATLFSFNIEFRNVSDSTMDFSGMFYPSALRINNAAFWINEVMEIFLAHHPDGWVFASTAELPDLVPAQQGLVTPFEYSVKLSDVEVDIESVLHLIVDFSPQAATNTYAGRYYFTTTFVNQQALYTNGALFLGFDGERWVVSSNASLTDVQLRQDASADDELSINRRLLVGWEGYDVAPVTHACDGAEGQERTVKCVDRCLLDGCPAHTLCTRVPGGKACQ